MMMSTEKAAGGGDDEDNDNIDFIIVAGMEEYAADEEVKKPSAGMTQEVDATGSPVKLGPSSSTDKTSAEKVAQTHPGAELSSITNRSFLSAVRTILISEPDTSELVDLIKTKITGNPDKIDGKALRKAFAAGAGETGQMNLGWPMKIINNEKRYGGPDALTGVSPDCLDDVEKGSIREFKSAQVEHSESGVGFWPKTGYNILRRRGYNWDDSLTSRLKGFYDEINSHNIGVGRSYATPSAKTQGIIDMFEVLYKDNQHLTNGYQTETDFPPLEILIIMIEFYLSWSQPNQIKSDATFMHDARRSTTRNHANHVHVFVQLLYMTMFNERRPDHSTLDIDSFRTRGDITNGKPLHAGTFFAFMEPDQIRKEAPIIKRCWETQGLNSNVAIMQSLETNITWRYEMMDSLRGALLYQTDTFGAIRNIPWKELFEFAHNELYGPAQTDDELRAVLGQRNSLTEVKLEENWRVLKGILGRRPNKQGGPKSSGSKKPTNRELLTAELVREYKDGVEEAPANAGITRRLNKVAAKKIEDAKVKERDRSRKAATVDRTNRARSRSRDKPGYGEKEGGTRRARKSKRKSKRTRRVRKSSKSSRNKKTRRRSKK